MLHKMEYGFHLGVLLFYILLKGLSFCVIFCYFFEGHVTLGQIVCLISDSDNMCASLAAPSSESLGSVKLK